MGSVLNRQYKLAKDLLALSADLGSRASVVMPEGSLLVFEGQHAGDPILTFRHCGELFLAFREDVLRNSVEVRMA